jgi:heme/copper-type cytochrome/quinol oxidase subunit 2
VLRFTSSSGISLFRRHLQEIPELGITLESVMTGASNFAGSKESTSLIIAGMVVVLVVVVIVFIMIIFFIRCLYQTVSHQQLRASTCFLS